MNKKIFLPFLVLMIIFSNVPVYAIDNNADYNQINEYLEENNIDVANELEKLISDYQSQKNEYTSQEELDKINALIDETQSILEEYQLSQKARVSFAVEIASVIAYFNSKGYKLSAELLTHMRDNKTLDSSYTPVYGYYVQASSVFRNISNGTSTSGSATFPNQGSTKEKDCYYAIHKFTYTKSSPSSKVVKINDRYDFAYDKDHYNGLAGIAVTSMYSAQVYGELTPYIVKISCSND